MQAKIHVFHPLSQGSSREFWFQTRPQGLCSIPFTYFDGRLSWWSNSIPFFVIKPFKEEKEMKILSTYLPLSVWNGCWHDTTSEPHVTRKCSIRFTMGEPVALIIEIPRCAYMKFQNLVLIFFFERTDARTHARTSRKQYAPHFFKVWGIKTVLQLFLGCFWLNSFHTGR